MPAQRIFNRICKRAFTSMNVRFRMLTKSTDCQSLKKPARRGSEPAKKGVYHYVNDRILQVMLTMEAKIIFDSD